MSDSEISEIQSSAEKYSYTIEDMTDWTDEDKDWIYWKGYWGLQTIRKMNGKEDLGSSGPPSPPYIDYINDGIEMVVGKNQYYGRQALTHQIMKFVLLPISK
ncbi:MAG: hypothetical protein NUV74_12530 [Candidatus Brocadiaceae bacterium]|nr:hypothetical protein [Candidatus Brocadiaceae bacterium]